MTEFGESVTDVGPGGLIVSVPDAEMPFDVAVIEACVTDATTVVEIVKLAVDWPPEMMTLAGVSAL
jgi:hypothetical protein